MGIRNEKEYSLVNIAELIAKKEATDTDILLIQDEEDTKKITLQNLILSIIKDNELPGEARIYSSQKMDQLFKQFVSDTQMTVTGMEKDVEDLKLNKVEQAVFEAAIKLIEEGKLSQEDLEPINNLLEEKRDINVPIKSEDLDTSDDEYKIKLANLSQEVLDAMIGDTPVAFPTVPEGGWLSRHIANRSIISTKLADTYRYKGLITDMTVNSITADGIYLLGSDVKDLPKYIDTDKNLCMLEVTRFGESGKYIKQEIEYYDNAEQRPRYIRKGVTTRIHTVPFEEVWDVGTAFKVDSHLLADEYNNRGVIDSGNIFDLEASGSYYITKNVTGLPKPNIDYILDIDAYGMTIIYTLKEVNKNYALIYVSSKVKLTAGVPTVTPWHSINKMNKSKFDGKKVLIFGDGISYGIGASSLSTTSYATLLKSQYGFVVQNNALGDATAGNYGDITCINRSLLTQIDNATIDDTCDYCIIFIGTNDWRFAKGDVGKVTNFDESTFCGSMNVALRSIFQFAPKIKPILVTPLYRSRQNYDDNKNSDDYPVNYIFLREYVDAVKAIGQYNHVPVIDLYNNLCINRYNDKFYLDDGVHPNDNGHKAICDQIFNHMSLYF